MTCCIVMICVYISGLTWARCNCWHKSINELEVNKFPHATRELLNPTDIIAIQQDIVLDVHIAVLRRGSLFVSSCATIVVATTNALLGLGCHSSCEEPRLQHQTNQLLPFVVTYRMMACTEHASSVTGRTTFQANLHDAS
jgi:hypothetical protein